MAVVVSKEIAKTLQKEVYDLKAGYLKLRIDASTSRLTNTSEIRKIKRKISRTLTYLNQPGAYEAFKKRGKSENKKVAKKKGK